MTMFTFYAIHINFASDLMRIETSMWEGFKDYKVYKHGDHINLAIDRRDLFFYRARPGKNKITFGKTTDAVRYFINKCETDSIEDCVLPNEHNYHYRS